MARKGIVLARGAGMRTHPAPLAKSGYGEYLMRILVDKVF